MSRAFVLSVLVALVVHPSRAQDLQTPEATVDALMAAYGGEGPGGVVAVYRGGEVVFAKGYGLADVEYAAPNTPATPYHMASVSKQFTAFAVALLAEQGSLSLDDDVRRYLPEVPDFGRTITLRHLLHHTSGLRDQWTLWVLAGGRMDDVIRKGDLMRLVEHQRDLNFEPGSEHLYSNTGYLLLSEVVARVTGHPFGEWMEANVFGPLGMENSQIYDDHERIVPGRAYSYYEDDGVLKKAVLSYANSGATSLFTTAEDLAHWLRNFATHEVGGPAVTRAMLERGVLTNGDTLDHALGVVIDRHRGLRRIQHSGGDAGYRTFLAYYPGIDAGVAVMGNVASFDPGVVKPTAEAFFAADMEDPTASVSDGPAVEVPEALLDAYAGEYQIENGPALTVVRSGNGLTAQIEGQPEAPLVAVADTLFRVDVPGVDAGLSFHPGPDGEVDRASTFQGDVWAPLLLRGRAAWEPSPEALGDYAGRYYSPELETAYVAREEGGRLVLVHRRHGEVELEPVSENAFRSGLWFMGRVEFDRDETGSVTGMRVSSDRVRNVRFQKEP